ncbi:MAG: DNA mismatch repair protein MutS [Candidatus Eisenbacteria bacterium]|nr:DNA mismatch repair protein MutS [Candidatus Eisenbacteria bacterium]
MSKLTPMMEQYQSIKSRHNDAILLFRMGDFYEMFFDDAKTAARVLGLALTTRDKGSKNPVPLAGVPHHALDSYLARLVAAGYRVAICDQVEDPKKAKGIVRREVTEVVTPGTLLAEGMLDDRRSNFLVSLAPGKSRTGLAKIDLSTGEFTVTELDGNDLRREVLRADASEILVPEGAAARPPLTSLLADLPDVPVSPVADWEFGVEQARETLTRHFGVANLDGFGCAGLQEGIAAAGAALSYLRDLKRRDLGQITSLRRVRDAEHMILDETTQRNLELVEPLDRSFPESTLLSVIDRTRTAMGARLLRQWVLYPLLDVSRVNRRLDAVEGLVRNREARKELADTLGELCDIPRVIGRIATGHAAPRDLVALRRSLELAPHVRELLAESGVEALTATADALPDTSSAVDTIRASIADNPPATLRNGGVIRAGYSEELDRVRSIARDGKGWIGKLQAEERERTRIPTLKIGYNKVFGYYLEVTKPHADLVPEHWMRKQTLVNAERYVTPELKEHESRVLTAEEDILRLEQELFDHVCGLVSQLAPGIQEAASVLARVDVFAALALAAEEYRYVRPEVTERKGISVRASRHPVVERLLKSEEFVPNDIDFNEESHQILLITGPNMAGKSTYLRQAGLVAIMAQMGSFVPAESAGVGVIDRIFTRIGATDALARGRSTFLVEMSETAHILRDATDRSLVLLDEIGRGTSTFDGLSIAWAVTEHLHNRGDVTPWTMFATHYHELTELSDVLPRLRNMNVLVRETEDSIVFLRKIVPGAADQSYGIDVARLAGIPASVIERAREVLANLEDTQYTQDALPRLAGGKHGPLAAPGNQLGLFETPHSEVEREIEELDLEQMTPLDAFDKLVDLRRRVKREQ